MCGELAPPASGGEGLGEGREAGLGLDLLDDVADPVVEEWPEKVRANGVNKDTKRTRCRHCRWGPP